MSHPPSPAEPSALVVPTVHLNGSGRANLLAQLEIAAASLRRALECLCDAAPHGRDYYPQGALAWQDARRQHDARVERLRSVLAELEELRRAVSR